LGYCYEKLNQPADARFYYKKSLHLNPENSFTYFKIAGTYMRQEQYKTAIKIMETGLKIKVKCFEFNLLIAQAYFQLDNLQQSVLYLTKCLTQKPKSIKAWEMMVICMYSLEDYNEGLEFVNKAIQLTNKPMFLYYKIAFLIALGFTKEAINLLDIAMLKSPKQLKYLTELEPRILYYPDFVNCIMNHLKPE
jgi:tetratricopeptide (TPR) repeat protein